MLHAQGVDTGDVCSWGLCLCYNGLGCGAGKVPRPRAEGDINNALTPPPPHRGLRVFLETGEVERNCCGRKGGVRTVFLVGSLNAQIFLSEHLTSFGVWVQLCTLLNDYL